MAAAATKSGFIDINSVQHLNTSSKEVSKALSSSEPRITFWGCRVVQVQGASSSVSLNWIAKKIVELRNEPEIFTHADFSAEYLILQKVSEFYKATDEQINNANFIIRVFNCIREFFFDPFFNPYTIRVSVEKELGDLKRAFNF